MIRGPVPKVIRESYERMESVKCPSYRCNSKSSEEIKINFDEINNSASTQSLEINRNNLEKARPTDIKLEHKKSPTMDCWNKTDNSILTVSFHRTMSASISDDFESKTTDQTFFDQNKSTKLKKGYLVPSTDKVRGRISSDSVRTCKQGSAFKLNTKMETSACLPVFGGKFCLEASNNLSDKNFLEVQEEPDALVQVDVDESNMEPIDFLFDKLPLCDVRNVIATSIDSEEQQISSVATCEGNAEQELNKKNKDSISSESDRPFSASSAQLNSNDKINIPDDNFTTKDKEQINKAELATKDEKPKMIYDQNNWHNALANELTVEAKCNKAFYVDFYLSEQEIKKNTETENKIVSIQNYDNNSNETDNKTDRVNEEKSKSQKDKQDKTLEVCLKGELSFVSSLSDPSAPNNQRETFGVIAIAAIKSDQLMLTTANDEFRKNTAFDKFKMFEKPKINSNESFHSQNSFQNSPSRSSISTTCSDCRGSNDDLLQTTSSSEFDGIQIQINEMYSQDYDPNEIPLFQNNDIVIFDQPGNDNTILIDSDVLELLAIEIQKENQDFEIITKPKITGEGIPSDDFKTSFGAKGVLINQMQHNPCHVFTVDIKQGGETDKVINLIKASKKTSEHHTSETIAEINTDEGLRKEINNVKSDNSIAPYEEESNILHVMSNFVTSIAPEELKTGSEVSKAVLSQESVKESNRNAASGVVTHQESEINDEVLATPSLNDHDLNQSLAVKIAKASPDGKITDSSASKATADGVSKCNVENILEDESEHKVAALNNINKDDKNNLSLDAGNMTNDVAQDSPLSLIKRDPETDAESQKQQKYETRQNKTSTSDISLATESTTIGTTSTILTTTTGDSSTTESSASTPSESISQSSEVSDQTTTASDEYESSLHSTVTVKSSSSEMSLPTHLATISEEQEIEQERSEKMDHLSVPGNLSFSQKLKKRNEKEH